MIELLLYSKEGCHLCHAAREAIRRFGAGRAVHFVERVIREVDPEFPLFQYEFPVLFADGVKIGAGRIDEDLLLRLVGRVIAPRSEAGTADGPT